jgi:hypothetical protein
MRAERTAFDAARRKHSAHYNGEDVVQFLNRTVARVNRMMPLLCIALALSAASGTQAATQSETQSGTRSGTQSASKPASKSATNPSTHASETKTSNEAQAASATATPDHVTPDDPVKVRDTLARQMPSGATHSLTDRIRNLAREPFDRIVRGRAATTENGQRTFLFMIPAPHGILYRANTDMLSVNVPLAGDEHPDTILLYQKIEGQSGRGLVIAPDAKAKGFIQKIDSIELRTDGKTKTTARGRLKLSQASFEQADDNFAIVLVCTLEPPYLSETREHSDPTDEEPTDISRRTSTLHANVQAVWLVNQKDGTVLAKGLRLAK